MQESLEDLDLRDAIEQRLGAGRIDRRQEPAGLGRVPQPVALFGHEHVGVVEAGGRAVDAAQLLDRLERVGRCLGDRAADERRRQPLQIVVGDAVRCAARATDRRAASEPSGSSCAARWP